MAKQTKEEIAVIKEANPEARLDYELKEAVGDQDANKDKKLALDLAQKDDVVRKLDQLISKADARVPNM